MPNTEWIASLRPSVNKEQLYRKPVTRKSTIRASIVSWTITAPSREAAVRTALLCALREGIYFRMDGAPLDEEDICVLSEAEALQDHFNQIAFNTFMVWIIEVGHSRNIAEFRALLETGYILKESEKWLDYFDEYLEALTGISKTLTPRDPEPLWSYLASVSPLKFMRKFPGYSKELMNLFIMYNLVPGKQAEFLANPRSN
jgi:hypothetical protein